MDIDEWTAPWQIPIYLKIGHFTSFHQRFYADLLSAQVLQVWDFFTNCRLDITACGKESIHALELTVCHETNLQSSHACKQNKYRPVGKQGSALAAGRHIVPHFIEVSTFFFLSKLSNFTSTLKITKMSKSVKNKIIFSALNSSFMITVIGTCVLSLVIKSDFIPVPVLSIC